MLEMPKTVPGHKTISPKTERVKIKSSGLLPTSSIHIPIQIKTLIDGCHIQLIVHLYSNRLLSIHRMIVASLADTCGLNAHFPESEDSRIV